MREQALVSIVIVNWNGRKFLKDCLSSLRNQTYKNHETILVDTGSVDGSVDFVAENFPEVKVVQHDDNIGPALARNLGFQKSSGKYIAFLDNDTEVDPDWLVELVNVLESDQTIGAAQSKILSALDRDLIWATGEVWNYYGDSFRKGVGEKDIGQYASIDEISSAISCAMLMESRVFKEVGMFDPVFFVGQEDGDLGWRIWLGGYRIVYVPNSVVYHIGDSTSRANGTSARAYATFSFRKNSIAKMIKNYSFKNLVKYVPVRIIMEILRARNKNRAITTLKAIMWNLTNFRYVWKEHSRVQHSLRRVSDKYIMERAWMKTSVFFKVARARTTASVPCCIPYKPIDQLSKTEQFLRKR